MEKPKKTSAVKPISRSALILSCISDGINTSSAIAEYTQLSKSTVHRLLNAMIEANLIIHDPIGRKYSIGGLITRLITRPQITHDYLIGCAHKEMWKLLDLAGETINLHIMVGIKCAPVYFVPSKNDLRVVEENREVSPVYAGAAGKMLLAQLDRRELKMALKNIKLEPITEYSITDKDELLAQLKQIKKQGFCICANERIVGAMGMSMPIENYTIPAALSIVGPEVRMKPRTQELLKALSSAASRISQDLKENYR